MINLNEWAIKWGVPAGAVVELKQIFGLLPCPLLPAADELKSEAAVQAAVRAEAGRQGIRAWRNNVGALQDATGRWVRYGLANDSKSLNEKVKSADLIGIKPVLITPALVGQTIGQFWSRECKPGGWVFTGTDREQAQLKWAEILTSLGADAAFTTGAV